MATAFVIREANPLALELAPQDSILFLDVCDDVLLMTVDPASQSYEQHLPRSDWLHERHYPPAEPVVVSSYKTSNRDRLNIWTLRVPQSAGRWFVRRLIDGAHQPIGMRIIETIVSKATTRKAVYARPPIVPQSAAIVVGDVWPMMITKWVTVPDSRVTNCTAVVYESAQDWSRTSTP